ncbi:MAG: hypothetical protein U1E76_16145 [Planctomycetota bacterium]
MAQASLPLRLDGEVPNLGKFAACRRVARTIYLGSAPTATAANRGLEDRRVKLGCVMPGESPAVFGDALRRLAGAATYLYQDGSRFWYSTQPSVTSLAEDRAEQNKRNPDAVARELEKRVREDVRKVGDFSRVHALPQGAQDVPDDLDARLVVLGIDQPCSKEAGTAAEAAAKAILESRGTAPRLYRNTLVFLAIDKTRLQDLDEAIRKFLAWESILNEKDQLDLSPHQVKQAQTQHEAADSVVTARLPEAYQWILVPTQGTAQATIQWQIVRLTGQEALAVRASKKLRNDELLVTSFAASRLRMDLDRVPLWRGDHVAIKQLVEDFARYLYLSRLKDPSVLIAAVRDGVALLTWTQDSFAYADSYDDAARRYQGLRAGRLVPVTDTDDPGLLVRPEVARKQLAAETASASTQGGASTSVPTSPGTAGSTSTASGTSAAVDPAKPRRFHGSVALDPARVGRDAGRIADEVIAHLAGLVGASVTVTLEVEAHSVLQTRSFAP